MQNILYKIIRILLRKLLCKISAYYCIHACILKQPCLFIAGCNKPYILVWRNHL